MTILIQLTSLDPLAYCRLRVILRCISPPPPPPLKSSSYATDELDYRTAGKFGRELYLVVWLSALQPPNKKFTIILYLHIILCMAIPYRTAKFKFTNIFLQWRFGAQLPNLIPAIFLAIQYIYNLIILNLLLFQQHLPSPVICVHFDG